jgi:hypothetical protein
MPNTSAAIAVTSDTLIVAALITIAVIYTVGIVGLVCVGRAAFEKTEKGAAKSFSLLFRRSIRFLTVAAIILAVAILSAIGRFTGVEATILSGIVGYVLGGAASEPSENESAD